jgi:hypothetical protein
VSPPRFLIVRGVTEQGVSAPEWPTREDPFAVAGRPDGVWFTWRLLSSNNRELGRSAAAHVSESGCLAAITVMQGSASVCVPSVNARSSGQWWWHLDLCGARVAVAGRVYQRQRECRYNLDQFMLALPDAGHSGGAGPSRTSSQAEPLRPRSAAAHPS